MASKQFPKLENHKGIAKGKRFAIVVSKFNQTFTLRLLKTCLGRLKGLGAAPDLLDVFYVPGAFELPLSAKLLAKTGYYNAVVCLGAVLRGDTLHYDLVCGEAARGIAQAGLDTEVPVIFGVITCDTVRQALERCSGGPKDAGRHAAEAAVWMADLVKNLKKAP